MTTQIQQKIISICNAKIEQKGENVGLSFYASFDNKNETPELWMVDKEEWAVPFWKSIED